SRSFYRSETEETFWTTSAFSWFFIKPCRDQLEERTFMCCLQETGLYEYKVYGVLTTCTPELCADVYMDLTYRKDWDGYVKGKKTETAQEGRVPIYWEVKYPFPLSNRDYVYVRERKDLDMDGRKIWVILAKSSPETPCSEKSGVLRVKDYKQSVSLESDGACGTKLFMNYFDNPGGNIPTWLVNWAAKVSLLCRLTTVHGNKHI
uniref:Phosphatidylcholine transfer protein n=1 Tax=Neolamprologus brichardi TaxID=32507 RepID=A0A3Q4H051_NEOBR